MNSQKVTKKAGAASAKKRRIKRQYPDEQKAAVLANLDANKGNVAKTAREADVPRKTLAAWKNGIGINEDVANISHVKKEELRDLHKLIAVRALGLLQNKLSDCSAVQLSTIAAISTDKMQVLSGEPDSITRSLPPEQKREKVREWLTEQGLLSPAPESDSEN